MEKPSTAHAAEVQKILEQNGHRQPKISRFDYVRYDEKAAEHQQIFKHRFTDLEQSIDNLLCSPRAKALAHTKLEECYMWIGKAIRDDQITRNGSAPLQEERKNG